MEPTLKCLIIDDEPISRDIIETYISKLPFLELSATCEDAMDAISFLTIHQVDIIFTDIQMPTMNGLDFVKTLKNKPATIFITAHSEYAIDGFNIGVVDFLSKPVEFDRFVLAVNRALDFIKKENGQKEKSYPTHVFIKADSRFFKINYDEVIYIESDKDYIIIHTSEKKYRTLMTLKSFEENLNPKIFFKIQRSYIINTNYIHFIMGNTIELTNKKQLVVSQEKKEELYSLLQFEK